MPATKVRNVVLLFIAVTLLTGVSISLAQQPGISTTFLPVIMLDRNRWIGPYGGFITAIALDSSNPLILYAGTWGSGVYKSQNGGQSWYTANDGLENLYINSLAINPVDPSILYAGTYKSQVYKSVDGGATWTWAASGMQDEAVVYALAIDPLAPDTIYAGTRGISNNGNPPWSGILYKSIDAGKSWKPVLEDLGGADVQDWIYSIAINPTQDNSVYVASHEHGPFRTNNSGQTWFAIHDGINDDSGRSIIISPDTSEFTTTYYGVWHFDSVYKSIDGGNDWFLANKNIPYTKVYSMAIDPLQTNRVYIASFDRGILKTVDGGLNWLAVGLADDPIYSLAIDPITPNTMYAGTAGDGLFKSPDAGLTWLHSDQGIQNTMATGVIVSPSDSDTLYASSFGGGVYTSTNRGSTWDGMNVGLEDKSVHQLVQDPANPGRLFALTESGGLFETILGDGKGWVSVGMGLPMTSIQRPAFPAGHPFTSRDSVDTEAESASLNHQIESTGLLDMVFSPTDTQTAYIGTNGSGVYKSTDGGTSWQPTGLAGESIQKLALDASNSQHVYAITLTPGVLEYSQDGGETWNEATLQATLYSLFASQNGLCVGTDDGLYLYLAGNFTQLGLAGETITAIAVDPTQPSRIFAGTTLGAYMSTDGGLTWNSLSSNLNGMTIQSIEIDPLHPTWVYFSTTTHGIYQAIVNR